MPDEKDKICNILRNTKFFQERNILNDDLNIVVQGLTFEEMKQDDYVFRFGTLGDKFYIILKGSVRILIPVKDKTQKEQNPTKRKSIFEQTEIKKKLTRRVSRIIDDANEDGRRVQITHNEEGAEEVEMREIGIIKEGSAFGELALIGNKPRAASIQCVEDSYFAVLNKTEYNKVFK